MKLRKPGGRWDRGRGVHPSHPARGQRSRIGVWGRAPGANACLMHKVQKHCQFNNIHSLPSGPCIQWGVQLHPFAPPWLRACSSSLSRGKDPSPSWGGQGPRQQTLFSHPGTSEALLPPWHVAETHSPSPAARFLTWEISYQSLIKCKNENTFFCVRSFWRGHDPAQAVVTSHSLLPWMLLHTCTCLYFCACMLSFVLRSVGSSQLKNAYIFICTKH